MRYLINLILGVFDILVGALVLANFVGCSPEGCATPCPAEPTRLELAKAHRYHGVLFSEQDEAGNWWGVRPSGQRILVWRAK